MTVLDNPKYIEGVRKAEEERKARKERSQAALNGMIDLIKTRDIDAAAEANKKAIERLNKYPPTPTSPFAKFTPQPRGRQPMKRNPEMFAGIGGSYAGSRRARREWERLLRKSGHETVSAVLAEVNEKIEATDDE